MIEITIKFSQIDLNCLLREVYLDQGRHAPKVKDLSKKQLRLLSDLLKASLEDHADDLVLSAGVHEHLQLLREEI